MHKRQVKPESSGTIPYTDNDPLKVSTGGHTSKKRLFSHREYDLHEVVKPAELVIPQLARLVEQNNAKPIIYNEPLTRESDYQYTKRGERRHRGKMSQPKQKQERPTSLQPMLPSRGNRHERLEVLQEHPQLNILQTHSTRDLRQHLAQEADRLLTQRQNRPQNGFESPRQVRRRDNQDNYINNYRSQQILPAPIHNLQHDRERQRSPSSVTRKSVEKLWNEVRVDQVILKQAQARQAMVLSDQRAKKYLERNPESFAKRVEANIRLNSLVRNPDFASMEDEDLYNLNRVKEYLHHKKTELRQGGSKSRPLSRHY